MKDMVVEGIAVAVTQKKMKSMRLYVKAPDGCVHLCAPLGTRWELMEAFVRAKLGWIRAQQARLAQLPPAKTPQYVPGETLWLWGRPYTLQVQSGAKNTLEIQGDAVGGDHRFALRRVAHQKHEDPVGQLQYPRQADLVESAAGEETAGMPGLRDFTRAYPFG
jgi:predicted metal-dependent hydrolase